MFLHFISWKAKEQARPVVHVSTSQYGTNRHHLVASAIGKRRERYDMTSHSQCLGVLSFKLRIFTVLYLNIFTINCDFWLAKLSFKLAIITCNSRHNLKKYLAFAVDYRTYFYYWNKVPWWCSQGAGLLYTHFVTAKVKYLCRLASVALH